MDAVTRRAWAYLSRVAEPPNPLLAQLVSAVGAVEAADRIRRRHPHLGEHLARSTRARHELDCAEADLDILDRMAGRLVTVDDDEYPGLAFTAFPKQIWRQIWSNNPQERLNKEIRRRTDVVGIFPDRDALIRLVGAVLAEQHDEWAESRRYLGLDVLSKSRTVNDTPTEQEDTPAALTA